MEDTAPIVSVPTAAHPWGPVVVNRLGAADKRLIKVVAFNARGGRALDRVSKALRAPPLSHPDIILLSEMDWLMRRSGQRKTAAELAADLGMSFAFIGEFGVQRQGQQPVSFFGSAILSNWPLTDVRVVPLAKTLTRRRILRLLGAPAGLAAKVTLNRRSVALGVAHLNSRWNPAGRELQMRQLLAGFPVGIPAILGGDFNTTTVELSSPALLIKVIAMMMLRSDRFRHPQRWEPLFERLRQAGFDIDGANVHGQATFAPSRLVPPILRPKLDWLAVRDLKPVLGSAAVVPARLSTFSPRFSDHDFIMCMVEA
jgi:endonuclease/exonuclease/phosphatase family metal-dependent hydrolase